MIKCGNCKEQHSTADEVRACYGNTIKLQDNGRVHPGNLVQPGPAGGVHTTPTETYGRGSRTNAFLTDNQRGFINRLLEERPSYAEVENYTPERIAHLTKAEASRLIDHLTNNVPREHLRDPEPRVPEGRYALPATTGGDDHMVFYQVYKPTTGKWAGRVFVALLVGAPGDFSRTNVPRVQQAAVLDRIAVDPIEAALRFSRKFTVCARCLSALSTVRSRATGFGPICSEKLGVRYIPYAEALALLDELGISKEGLEDLDSGEHGPNPNWREIVAQSIAIHPDWDAQMHWWYLVNEEFVKGVTLEDVMVCLENREWVGNCEHGLSTDLCAGPSHYPMDM